MICEYIWMFRNILQYLSFLEFFEINLTENVSKNSSNIRRIQMYCIRLSNPTTSSHRIIITTLSHSRDATHSCIDAVNIY